MPEINFEEFSSRVARSNPDRDILIGNIDRFGKSFTAGWDVRFAPKGNDLVEIVDMFSRQRTSPVVDKRSGFIYGISNGFHEVFRGHLFDFHFPAFEGTRDWLRKGELYISRSCGYFVSSSEPSTIVCGQGYREDSFDADLFMQRRVLRDVF